MENKVALLEKMQRAVLGSVPTVSLVVRHNEQLAWCKCVPAFLWASFHAVDAVKKPKNPQHDLQAR